MALLDRLTSSERHAVLMAVAGAAAYGLPIIEADYTSWGLPAPVVAFLGVALPYAALWVSKINGQYGRGSVDQTPAVAVDALPDAAPVDPAATAAAAEPTPGA